MMDFGDLAALAVFIFGALTLCFLTAFYWIQSPRRRFTALAAFTLICTIAFLNNLLLQSVLVRNLAAGLIPVLMLHVVVEFVSVPRRFLSFFYAAATLLATARGLNESGLLITPGTDVLYFVPPCLLAVAVLVATGLLVSCRRRLPALERAYRRTLLVVLMPLGICALANLGEPSRVLRQLPDYLVLVFLGVTLYYRERLAFIDLLVKRGAFFAVGMAFLAAALMLQIRSIEGTAALMLVLWLMGPPVYAWIDRAIDSIWLRRPYSPVEAERQFIHDVQPASSEEELRACAARSLSTIFRSHAEVLAGPAPSGSDDGRLCVTLDSKALSVVIAPRPDGIPFLSDDSRLLQSLSGTLGVVLEKQQLRWLANRAELKALRAQINPHFLFNALSVITGLIESHPELAAETVEELAQVFRYTLRKSENEWTPLAEEVEFVAAYLRIEQARFGKRLRVDLQVDPAAACVRIPAMSIQPLIENAIKHGISYKEGGGEVGLRATLEGGQVFIRVFDTGPGFPPGFSLAGSAQGHGLRNVMERLRGYYGESASLCWQSTAERTEVALTFPQGVLCG